MPSRSLCSAIKHAAVARGLPLPDMKPFIVLLSALLLNGCPFLPPSMFQHVAYGVYPESTISLPVGESMNDAEHLSIPGFYDIVSVDSKLDGETLSATLYLRELPNPITQDQSLGHMQDFQAQWIVMVEVEGDTSTPFEWHDYVLRASYYVPTEPRINQGLRLPSSPWVMTTIRQCEPDVLEDSGREYNSCTPMDKSPILYFSREDISITLVATVPGITKSSTIAFWVWGMIEEHHHDFVPKD